MTTTTEFSTADPHHHHHPGLRPWANRVEDWAVVALVTKRRPSRVHPDERECILHARDAHYTAARNGTHCLGGDPVLDHPAVRFGGPWDAGAVEDIAARLRRWIND